MYLSKQCRTCEFDFSGICVGHGNVYKYGETIMDNSIGCDAWGANVDYFTEITTQAPWYIKESYDDSKIDYSKFLKLIEADADGQAIEVNIFDAIQKIYGLSLVDLAVILDVSFGVMHKARSVGVPIKRLSHFSQKLCIPASLFQTVTTHNFNELEMCKCEFKKHEDIDQALQSIPNWKRNLIVEVTNCLHCPVHVDRKISCVDKLNWKKENTSALNNNERALINFVEKTGKEAKQSLLALEYKLDIGCHPNMHMTFKNDK